ncbi:MAG: hypothetical protein IJD60_03675, partial [Clostridia bacterium]|nr:hypothetical protein [Clostridia bacterium]
RILAADKTSFSCTLRVRPENDIGSGLQPLLAPRMSLLRISYEGAAALHASPKFKTDFIDNLKRP